MSGNGVQRTISPSQVVAPTSPLGNRLPSVKQAFLEGGPGCCQFAINNACNAACDFCSFSLDALPREGWIFAPLAESREAIDILVRHGVRYLVITGGEPMLHPDWNFLLWRCHYWEEPICSIFEFDDSRRIRDGCTRCMIDCYRDASVMQHVAIFVSDSIAQARHGMWRDAAKSLFNRDNLVSLKSVFEGLGWISRI